MNYKLIWLFNTKLISTFYVLYSKSYRANSGGTRLTNRVQFDHQAALFMGVFNELVKAVVRHRHLGPGLKKKLIKTSYLECMFNFRAPYYFRPH